MQDQVSRLIGLDGFEVTYVIEVGDTLELVVQLVAPAGCCPRCGRGTLEVKERPVVRVRDWPLAGRPTYLRWRKRRYRCGACERTATDQRRRPRPRRPNPMPPVSRSTTRMIRMIVSTMSPRFASKMAAEQRSTVNTQAHTYDWRPCGLPVVFAEDRYPPDYPSPVPANRPLQPATRQPRTSIARATRRSQALPTCAQRAPIAGGDRTDRPPARTAGFGARLGG
ncbi:MAG: transposase family protein [Solirubrobacteraceae bacterium]